MNPIIPQEICQSIRDFHLPRYQEIPDVGLYLEQTSKYISDYYAPLSEIGLTSSMISNYVKKGVIDSPVKKMYYAEHLAYLIFICVGKSVMSIDDISDFYKIQKRIYPCDVAYDYFCMEFENMLGYTAGIKETLDSVGTTNTELKTALRSVIASAAHLVFARESLRQFRERGEV